jgi:AbrB family looped-hinge helix DNA binding protein
METRISTKGQVVLPGPVRRKLGLRAGDQLEVRSEHGHIVLTPKRKRSQKVSVVTDPITGLPVLAADPEAPRLTSKQVEEILSSLP